ncbi:ABC transporter permease [Oceanicella actignis]|uniref:Putative hydroxymethylpyrimidine transport system permease protein n=1 Tax=Oceanicella actignis TaxID=1189325 RepID=A0A1M7RT39_9RHOB|nr:ABC transporter permease [Oceanicella actignis]SET05146.1 putative hydroxymethylpyrimidine transport system permease protein [Oceanicella actignis]SHN49354.1 putative hydroxymethylpyrimidine transport system permease protein [Oceanicella actignis]
MRAGLARALPACAGLGLWEAAARLGAAPPYILPAPSRVVQTAWRARALLAEHAAATAAEILAGLAIGAALGIGAALAMAASRPLERALRPALTVSQALPVFALAPMLTLWMGYGMAPKIAMAVLIIFFPVASAFHDGLRGADPAWIELARNLGARPGAILLRIRAPAAAPHLAAGLRIAATTAPIGAVVGEWVGSGRGLGYLMLLANGRAQTDLMFAALAVLAALALALRAGVEAACAAALARLGFAPGETTGD